MFCIASYGEVRKCLHIESKALRSVRILNTRYLKDEEKENIVNEIEILKKLDHPNIIKHFEVFKDYKNVYMITDVFKGFPLMEKII